MFRAAPVTKPERRKQPKDLPTDEWVKCGLPTRWSITAFKRKEILKTWKKLQDIILSKISQSQKDPTV